MRRASYAELGALPRSGANITFSARSIIPVQVLSRAGSLHCWLRRADGMAALTSRKLSQLKWDSDPSVMACNRGDCRLTAAHCSTHRHSGGTQTGFTVLKLLLIVTFSVAALTLSPAERQVTFNWRSEDRC